MGAGTVGSMGIDLYPTGQERPSTDDRNVPAAVGEVASREKRAYHAGTHGTNKRNETMHKTSILIAILALTCACSPLRQSQTSIKEQTEISDTTLTELIRRQIEHHFGMLRQTVIEFYPLTEHPSPTNEDRNRNLPDTLRAVLPPQKIPAAGSIRQSVKRITYTEASVQNDKSTQTDSISHSRINIAARSDTQTVMEEKPSSGVAWLKWATALAGLLLLILLFFKLR